MNYYLFFQDWEGNLHQIGYVNGTGVDEQQIIDDLWQQINEYLQSNMPNHKVYYYNIWNHDGFTIVDFGSHTEFFKIRPTIDFSK